MPEWVVFWSLLALSWASRWVLRGTGRVRRIVSEGFLVLADAINRAGFTEPAKIQKALRETDLNPEQLMIGYRGVKFGDTGQNTLSATYLIQLHGKKYKSVWPENRASAKLAWPMSGWRK